MNLLRSILTASIALAVFSNTPLRAETFPIFEDAAGSATTNLITKAAGAAKTMAVSAKSTAFINFAVGSGQGDPTFNIDPATVTSARLIIFLPKGSKTGTLSIKNLTSAFTETIATANIPAPTLGATLDTIDLATIPLNGDYYTSDITAQVKAWLTTPASEFGVAITSDGTASAILASKEGAGSGHPAVIEIEVNRGGGKVAGTTAIFSGTVGIGTVSPQASLHVSSSTGDGEILVESSANQAKLKLVAGNATDDRAARIDFLNAKSSATTPQWTLINDFSQNGTNDFWLVNALSVAVLTAKQDGNIGIGTSSPSHRLSIESNDNALLSLTRTGAGGGSFNLNYTGVSGQEGLYFSEDGVNSSNLVLREGGNVGISTSTPSAKLEVNGGIKCIGAVDTSSDARYKTNVAPLAGALDKARRLRGVSYDWNRAAFPQKDFGDRHQLGFIAQEVREILPDAVSEDHDGYLSIGYTAIIPVLAEAIEELQTQKDAEIAALKQQVAALEARDAAREARVARMERALGDSPVRTVRASLDLK